MNRHFDDARYYMRNALTHVKRGVLTELEPVTEWIRAKTGLDVEPEPGRIETARTELREFVESVEGEASEALDEARGRLRSYR